MQILLFCTMKHITIYLFFITFFCNIKLSFSQSPIYAVVEKNAGNISGKWPCYLAELNVNNCQLKKIIDLDSLGIHWIFGIIPNNQYITIYSAAYNDYAFYQFGLEDKKLKKIKKYTSSKQGDVSFGASSGRTENSFFLGPVVADIRNLREINLDTDSITKVWKLPISNYFDKSLNDYLPLFGYPALWHQGNLLFFNINLYKADLSIDKKYSLVMDSTALKSIAMDEAANGSTTCDTSILYTLDVEKGMLSLIDLKYKTIKNLCSNPELAKNNIRLGGMQSRTALNCATLIDLDENDNSGKTKNDYAPALICTPSVPIAINDKDLIVNSSLHIDSIRCYIFSGQKDGKQEQLQCFLPSNNTVSVKGNNSGSLTLVNNKWAKSLEFAEAIRQIRYVNKNAKFTKGERVIALQMYAQGEKSDTAKAFLLLIREDAGKDSIVSICKKTPVLLTDYLNGASNKYGEWYPPLASGTALFNPQKDKFGKYLYVLTGICNTDTSIFKLNDYSTSFVKNIDTTLCFANTFKTKNKEYKTSGIYQESYPYQNGCDSLTVNVKLTIRPEAISKIDTVLIEGQNYTINKQNINKSGDYTIKLTNRFGCDSTINLKIIVKENDIKKYIPSVFTPDGEPTENQVFKILENAPIKQIKKLYIFNRWGEMVFKVENVSHKDTKSFWDGTFNNQKLASDVYIYHLEVETAVATPSINGEITLLR